MNTRGTAAMHLGSVAQKIVRLTPTLGYVLQTVRHIYKDIREKALMAKIGWESIL